MKSRDDEERRLMDAYAVTMRHYSSAVNQLSNQRGSSAAFNEALKLVDEARKACEAARLALAEFRKSAKQI